MEKLKEAIKAAMGETIDESGITAIMDMLEIKIEEKATTKVDAVIAEKLTELETKNTEELKEFKVTLSTTIGEYLDVSMNEWSEENKPAIESESIVEMSKNVLTSLTTALKENHIVIPDSDIDIVKELEEQKSTLEKRVNDQINENITIKSQNFENEKAVSFLKLSEGMVDTQKEKVMALIVEMSCDDIESFERKLTMIIGDFSDSSSADLNESLIPDETDKTLIEGKKLEEEKTTISPNFLNGMIK